MFTRSVSKTSSQSIPSFGGVSLTGAGWMLRHKDSWDDKHHVFFEHSVGFYQNTTSAAMPSQNPKSRASQSIESTDLWVLETADGTPIGRCQIRATYGDFNHALLHVELKNSIVDIDICAPLADLITSQFLGQTLDTLKIFPLGPDAEACLTKISPVTPQKILSFDTDWLPNALLPLMFQFDLEQWMTSTWGQSSAEKLNWLKRRVDRAKSVSSKSKAEPKRPWLLSLLSMGRGRRAPMVHPLQKLRARR